ncbi:MAG TPA: DUF979 domain-containing protein [Sphingomonas sp.]|nr:DUF979 domain-containing protein [Sphingomonas sp.]
MIGLSFIYTVAGTLFAFYAALSLAGRRLANAAFWGLLALSFLFGNRLGDLANGFLVLGLVAVAASGRMRRSVGGEEIDRAAEAARRGNRLFLPVLVIPATALVGTLAFQHWPALADPKQGTLVALTLGVLLALAAACLWLRPRAVAPIREGLRLMDSVGWAAVLPQMLASLGAVFALSGVGTVVGGLIGRLVPHGSLIGATIAYGLGMALFTIVMGNAFAAFPVMMAAVGLPLLIHGHHGDPAAVAAIGMLCGFCGTLLTPMAANFNIVPAVLLDLRDRYGVIRQQVATALPLLAVNIAFIIWFAF